MQKTIFGTFFPCKNLKNPNVLCFHFHEKKIAIIFPSCLFLSSTFMIFSPSMIKNFINKIWTHETFYDKMKKKIINLFQGQCERTMQDVVERIWDFIDDFNINSVLKFLKDNIVGTVVIVSLIFWVPISCLISYVDNKRAKKVNTISCLFTIFWYLEKNCILDSNISYYQRDNSVSLDSVFCFIALCSIHLKKIKISDYTWRGRCKKWILVLKLLSLFILQIPTCQENFLKIYW